LIEKLSKNESGSLGAITGAAGAANLGIRDILCRHSCSVCLAHSARPLPEAKLHPVRDIV